MMDEEEMEEGGELKVEVGVLRSFVCLMGGIVVLWVLVRLVFRGEKGEWGVGNVCTVVAYKCIRVACLP